MVVLLSANSLRDLHGAGDALAPVAPAPAAPAPRSAPAPRGLKPNAYAGNCVNCGGRVAANEGLRDRRDNRWIVLHLGECPAPTAAPPASAPVAVTDRPRSIADGDYTLITEGGHRTFNVETQGDEDDFAAGETVIRYLSGRDNESDWTGFGFVKGTRETPRVVTWKRFRVAGYEALHADLALFLANVNRKVTLGLGDTPDPDEDREAFTAWRGTLPVGTVLLAKKCRRCHAKLTNPDSIEAEIGPVCATR